MTARSIALIGLSGSGKSTLARVLAARLGWPWADTDLVIEELAGASIPEIFSAQGEAAFREIEERALRQALETPVPLALATGGGIVLRPANRELLRRKARVVWLDAPTALLVERLRTHAEERPLLSGDAAARIAALHAQRAQLYAETADLHLDSSGLQPAQVADRILAWLEQPC